MTLSETQSFADLSTSCASASVALLDKRSRALADYWRAIGVVRAPSEVLALNLSYCTQMMDDYARAFSEAMATTAEAEPEITAAPVVQAPTQAA